MNDFTDEQKDKLLLSNGYTKIIGYMMDGEAPETGSVIISVEEIKECIGKKAETYYHLDDDDYCYNLEETWEEFYERLSLELDTEDDKIVFEYLSKKLKEIEVKENAN